MSWLIHRRINTKFELKLKQTCSQEAHRLNKLQTCISTSPESALGSLWLKVGSKGHQYAVLEPLQFNHWHFVYKHSSQGARTHFYPHITAINKLHYRGHCEMLFCSCCSACFSQAMLEVLYLCREIKTLVNIVGLAIWSISGKSKCLTKIRSLKKVRRQGMRTWTEQRGNDHISPSPYRAQERWGSLSLY